MVTKPAVGHRSLSPFLWNWTWPPSGPSYKAYSDSTILPLTRSSRVLCSVSLLSSPISYPSLFCIFIKSSFFLPHPTTLHYTMPDASKPIQKGGAPPHLVSYPSLSNSLSMLPQAKNLAHVSVYTSSMSGQHAAESEAKVCNGSVPLTIWTPVLITDVTSFRRRC
jgi:hypothetical protein